MTAGVCALCVKGLEIKVCAQRYMFDVRLSDTLISPGHVYTDRKAYRSLDWSESELRLGLTPFPNGKTYKNKATHKTSNKINPHFV